MLVSPFSCQTLRIDSFSNFQSFLVNLYAFAFLGALVLSSPMFSLIYLLVLAKLKLACFFCLCMENFAVSFLASGSSTGVSFRFGQIQKEARIAAVAA